MSTSTVMGNSDGLVTGLCPAPPPPPPPPVPGQVPAMRINTAQAPTIKRPQVTSNGAYEPPAAIQNAMLTKDKKPFTYTPGMGGKLDLSQIRSPRMARRVAKNANDEGIEGPPKSALESKPTPSTNTGANLFVQPQVAIPVFPTNVPVQPPLNRTPSTPPISRVQPSSPEKQPESPKAVAKIETKMTPVIAVQPSTPDSPSTPTQVTLAKAPTPWLQNKNKPQEELPEWAKRSPANKQGNSSSSSASSSPDSPASPPVYASSIQQQPPQWQQSQQRPQIQQPQQYQYQQQQQFNQKRPFSSPSIAQQTSSGSQSQERVIPIRIEDRPSVFDAKPEAGHQQFKQPSSHHQQRWGQPSAQSQLQSQVQQSPQPQAQQSTGGTFVIPIMIEGSDRKPAGGSVSNVTFVQPTLRNSAPNAEGNQSGRVVGTAQRAIPVQVQQTDSGPVQSRSFRVLQKITDTDSMNDADPEQMRKLQLSDDDRILMNKFKEQVDNDSSLHHEEDPRYRGAAIPSRAFRFLQNMTESGETPVMNTTPRPPSAITKKQNRNSKTFEETQANLPPSEQQVPEPKKYMGSAIPSRSFRILQAMTAPESVATQENRQADYHCQTENNVPGNQQGVFLPPCPPPFWTPENGWWGYYPLPYQGSTNESYPCHPDNTAYVYFPIYNQNYPLYPRFDPTTNKNACPGVYQSYVIPVPSSNDNNNSRDPSVETDGNFTATEIEPQNIQSNVDLNENEIKNERNEDAPGYLQWDRANSMSRTASNNSKDSDCTTAMNITDEEVIPETIILESCSKKSIVDTNGPKNGSNGSLDVSGVPNYTYIDTSDSSDSIDSESQSDDESDVVESSKISSDNDSGETSSDSDDSASYLAYSTGLNPHGRLEKEVERSSTRDCSNQECLNGERGSDSSENNTDCDSDVEEGKTCPHQLSVIYEDVEHPDSESPRPQEVRSAKKRNETPLEAIDDQSDDVDTTTVSVSLPLRFKFSVSENNEDVTTVIVGDSTIKPDRICSKEQNRNGNGVGRVGKASDVSTDFLVNQETTVDFTLKRDAPAGKRKTRKDAGGKIKEDTIESKVEKDEDPVVPHVNFTLRRTPSRLRKINCEETVETEFTIRRRPSTKKEDEVKDTNAKKSNDESVNEESSKGKDSFPKTEFEESNSVARDFIRNILKPEVIVSDCNCPDEAPTEISTAIENTAQLVKGQSTLPKATKTSKEAKSIEDEEKSRQDSKHLLSVQNSREETDDEDSGVTSDMSRMISEVDTDSECTSSRNMKKYQRTQTHSRLFRLLNDDSILPEDSEKANDSTSGRDCLSLPLNSGNFNYDDSYCSNYSSGITSPEYSPVSEQSWRRLHDAENSRVPNQNGDPFLQGNPLARQDRTSCKEDPYYQAWKSPKSQASLPKDHEAVPSLAFKVLESRRPPWSYKVNVLCPRIKSTKSVPRTLRTSRQTDSLLNNSSNPSSFHGNVKSDHC